MGMTEPEQFRNRQPRYKWPWFVLAAVLLGILLSVLWVTAAARRTRELRETDPFAPIGEAAKEKK